MLDIRDDSAPASTTTTRPHGAAGETPIAGEYGFHIQTAEEHPARKDGRILLHLVLITDGGWWVHEYVEPTRSRIDPILACLGQSGAVGAKSITTETLAGMRGRATFEVEPATRGPQGQEFRAKLRVARNGWIDAKAAPTGDEIPF